MEIFSDGNQVFIMNPKRVNIKPGSAEIVLFSGFRPPDENF